MVSNPKPNKGKCTSLPTEKPTCGKCGKKHFGNCLKGLDNCFGYGKSGNNVRDFTNVRVQDKGSGQVQESVSDEALKKNRFYTPPFRGEQEISPDMVTGMLRVFSIDVYALLDPGATLSFVTPLVPKKFDIFPDIFHEPFIVSTPVGESVIAKRMYRNYLIMLPNIVSYVELGELDMFDFHIILCMDWVHAFFAYIDCRTRVVKFKFPNEAVVEFKGENSIPRYRIISCIKAFKMISKGCLYHIVRSKILTPKFFPVVSEFLEVFPNDVPDTPPKWVIDFATGCKSLINSYLSDGCCRMERVEGTT
ncbi:uncharacterized protein [Solanum lycopersicum]|uniref:uncharacterized protein n=1 Tax=Solanum lycopersicum TaxID=4081 RepID=UPI0037494962